MNGEHVTDDAGNCIIQCPGCAGTVAPFTSNTKAQVYVPVPTPGWPSELVSLKDYHDALRQIERLRHESEAWRPDDDIAALLRRIAGSPDETPPAAASNEQFLDGTLKFGSVAGSRTGDPSVLQVVDPSEGQQILLSVNEARALHLWLGMVLPHSSAPETSERPAHPLDGYCPGKRYIRSKLFQQFLEQDFWHAHHVDLVWRYNGEDVHEEADWLKDVWYALRESEDREPIAEGDARYYQAQSSEKASAHRAEDAAEQSERDMLARGRQASGEPT